MKTHVIDKKVTNGQWWTMDEWISYYFQDIVNETKISFAIWINLMNFDFDVSMIVIKYFADKIIWKDYLADWRH